MKIKESKSEAATAHCEDNKKKAPVKDKAPNNLREVTTLQTYRIIFTHFYNPLKANLI